jgi:hypothetical protein
MSLIHCVYVANSVFSDCLIYTTQFPLCVSFLTLHFLYTHKPRVVEHALILIKKHTCIYTGRFVMFSVIASIYNKQTKGPTLMELFTATGKLTLFLTTTDVRCVHREWHGTHRYDIQVLATHASTGCIDILHCCNDPCRPRYQGFIFGRSKIFVFSEALKSPLGCTWRIYEAHSSTLKLSRLSI